MLFPAQEPVYELPLFARLDRVSVPDGRRGEVIGFYRGEDEHMLVLFDSGGTRRYLPAELRLDG